MSNEQYNTEEFMFGSVGSALTAVASNMGDYVKSSATLAAMQGPAIGNAVNVAGTGDLVANIAIKDRSNELGTAPAL